jgi:methylmalonic aciduria homocystinuria type C protein
VTAADASLARAGIDLVHRFDARAVASALSLPALAAAPVGVLIGNTRALWEPFLAARRADPALRATRDPIELYVERAVAAAFPGAPAMFSHRRYGGAFLPFQRVAVAAGVGALAPIGLVIHPVYGPWFALRAIVMCDGSPPATGEVPLACRCEAPCLDAVTRAQAGRDWRLWLAVRDACPRGREHRYSDAQCRYHYAHDPYALE